ncbi:MAG TPA: hypothetical protein VF591_19170 [Pyrinomonadaceae bacterium]
MSILYATIALTAAESGQVSAALRARPVMAAVANWFDANRANLYGARIDDWRPFDRRTIGEILNEGEENFRSQTNLVEGLYNGTHRSLNVLRNSGIEVYFIDVFALFLDRHRQMANRLDGVLAESEKCCFILPYGLSADCETLLTECGQHWPTVFDSYIEEGALHRIAMRPAELTHVRGYCLKHTQGGPNPALAAQMLQRAGETPTEVPRIAAR